MQIFETFKKLFFFFFNVSGVISNMTSLEVLDMSHNEITEWPEGSLGPLPNLTQINLSHNLLSDIPIDELTGSLKLSLVDLQNNRLTRFYDEFMPLMEHNATKVLMQGSIKRF